MSEAEQSDPSPDVPEARGFGVESQSDETLAMKLDKIQTELAKRRNEREDTGVHKINTRELEAAIDAKMQAALLGVGASIGKKIRNWILGVLATVGVPAGGVITWSWTHQPTEVDAAEVQETVNEAADDLEMQVEDNAEAVRRADVKIRALGREVIRRDDERAEQLDFISDKIDEISPKAARVEPPAAVKKRRDKKARDAMDRRVDALFGPEEGDEL